MLEVGVKAPDFTLFDKEGNSVSLSQFLGKKIDLQRTGQKMKHMLESTGYTLRMLQEYLHLSCVQPIYRWYKGLVLTWRKTTLHFMKNIS